MKLQWKDKVQKNAQALCNFLADELSLASIKIRPNWQQCLDETLFVFNQDKLDELNIEFETPTETDPDKYLTGYFITIAPEPALLIGETYVVYIRNRDQTGKLRSIANRTRTLIHELVHLVMSTEYTRDEFCERIAHEFSTKPKIVKGVKLILKT